MLFTPSIIMSYQIGLKDLLGIENAEIRPPPVNSKHTYANRDILLFFFISSILQWLYEEVTVMYGSLE